MSVRVVVDTNVLISALMSSRSVPGRILAHFELQAFAWLISDDIFREYAFALRYEKVRKRHRLTDAQISQFLDDLRAATVYTRPTHKFDSVVSDPNDNMLFECALAGGAHFIVSGDIAVQQVQSFRDIQVLSPSLFLAVLEQSQR